MTSSQLPQYLEYEENGEKIPLRFEYTLNQQVQEAMQGVLDNYSPDYGAVVAIDPQTGRIISMVSYSRRGQQQENLALRATFPSASIFKVVTAAAAIAEKSFSANTVIPYNGRNHTLYRRNVFDDRANRWTRYITLKNAFAKSVNTVFGRIGAVSLGAHELREYAERFGFNQKIATDVPMQEGRAEISDDPWSLAEAASGYTRDNTMSPLHGALIAAAIANDGKMMEPYLVDSVWGANGEQKYQSQPKVARESVDHHTAAEVRNLMRETITHGTSRKSFRGFFRGRYTEVDVGGKTGSLTGTDPQGKYDWFVGFAEARGKRIAICALTINERNWRVKSSYLARRLIETYYRDQLGVQDQKAPRTTARSGI